MWLLAVVDGAPPPDLDTVQEAGLTAVVERDAGRLEESPIARMLRQAEVVAGLLLTAESVVPARGGSQLDGEAEVRRVLRERSRDLHAALDRVRGGVELAVVCDVGEDDGAGSSGREATDGRAYLDNRVRQWRRTDGVAQRVAELADLPGVREARVLTTTAGGLTASLLVELTGWESTRAAVMSSARTWPGATRCTGPFPAYSFTAPSVVPA